MTELSLITWKASIRVLRRLRLIVVKARTLRWVCRVPVPVARRHVVAVVGGRAPFVVFELHKPPGVLWIVEFLPDRAVPVQRFDGVPINPDTGFRMR